LGAPITLGGLVESQKKEVIVLEKKLNWEDPYPFTQVPPHKIWGKNPQGKRGGKGI